MNGRNSGGKQQRRTLQTPAAYATGAAANGTGRRLQHVDLEWIEQRGGWSGAYTPAASAPATTSPLQGHLDHALRKQITQCQTAGQLADLVRSKSQSLSPNTVTCALIQLAALAPHRPGRAAHLHSPSGAPSSHPAPRVPTSQSRGDAGEAGLAGSGATLAQELLQLLSRDAPLLQAWHPPGHRPPHPPSHALARVGSRVREGPAGQAPADVPPAALVHPPGPRPHAAHTLPFWLAAFEAISAPAVPSWDIHQLGSVCQALLQFKARPGAAWLAAANSSLHALLVQTSKFDTAAGATSSLPGGSSSSVRLLATCSTNTSAGSTSSSSSRSRQGAASSENASITHLSSADSSDSSSTGSSQLGSAAALTPPPQAQNHGKATATGEHRSPTIPPSRGWIIAFLSASQPHISSYSPPEVATTLSVFALWKLAPPPRYLWTMLQLFRVQAEVASLRDIATIADRAALAFRRVARAFAKVEQGVDGAAVAHLVIDAGQLRRARTRRTSPAQRKHPASPETSAPAAAKSP
ncbi:MAG: hypothetical protein WDW38_009508 [Sanguina aurantia]